MVLEKIVALLTVSYLATWLSGLYNAKQSRFNRDVIRRVHLGLSLIT